MLLDDVNIATLAYRIRPERLPGGSLAGANLAMQLVDGSIDAQHVIGGTAEPRGQSNNSVRACRKQKTGGSPNTCDVGVAEGQPTS